MPAVRREAAVPARATPTGQLSRSRTTDAQKPAAGVMTAAQLAEHTALRRGAITGKPPRPSNAARWPMTRGRSGPPARYRS